MPNFSNNVLWILVLVTILIFALICLIARVIRDKMLDKILDLLNNRHFAEFDDFMERKTVKLFFDPFNIDYIKLNSYFLRNDDKKIDEIFRRLDEVRISSHQRDEVELEAFNYYLSKNNIERIDHYYNKIQSSKSNKLKKQIDRLYSIYVKKEAKYLNELIEETNKMDDKYKSANELLIAAIYGNIGNKKEQKTYERLAEFHLRQS